MGWCAVAGCVMVQFQLALAIYAVGAGARTWATGSSLVEGKLFAGRALANVTYNDDVELTLVDDVDEYVLG